MNDLVFLEPDKIGEEPFTTSDVIAQWTGNSYRSVQRIIEKQIKALKNTRWRSEQEDLPSE